MHHSLGFRYAMICFFQHAVVRISATIQRPRIKYSARVVLLQCFIQQGSHGQWEGWHKKGHFPYAVKYQRRILLNDWALKAIDQLKSTLNRCRARAYIWNGGHQSLLIELDFRKKLHCTSNADIGVRQICVLVWIFERASKRSAIWRERVQRECTCLHGYRVRLLPLSTYSARSAVWWKQRIAWT